MKKLLHKIFGYCGFCKRWFVYPYTARRNTAFVEDHKNYMYACKSCHKGDYEDYESLWNDYYSSRL